MTAGGVTGANEAEAVLETLVLCNVHFARFQAGKRRPCKNVKVRLQPCGAFCADYKSRGDMNAKQLNDAKSNVTADLLAHFINVSVRRGWKAMMPQGEHSHGLCFVTGGAPRVHCWVQIAPGGAFMLTAEDNRGTVIRSLEGPFGYVAEVWDAVHKALTDAHALRPFRDGAKHRVTPRSLARFIEDFYDRDKGWRVSAGRQPDALCCIANEGIGVRCWVRVLQDRVKLLASPTPNAPPERTLKGLCHSEFDLWAEIRRQLAEPDLNNPFRQQGYAADPVSAQKKSSQAPDIGNNTGGQESLRPRQVPRQEENKMNKLTATFTLQGHNVVLSASAEDFLALLQQTPPALAEKTPTQQFAALAEAAMKPGPEPKPKRKPSAAVLAKLAEARAAHQANAKARREAKASKTSKTTSKVKSAKKASR